MIVVDRIYPVILCGGSGTRLWPVSCKSYPKQFIALLDETTLFQHAALRAQGAEFEAPIVVTADDYRFIVNDQLEGCGVVPSAILIEPTPRNTAPAVLASALWVFARDPDGLILVMPSDHHIPDRQAFQNAVLLAKNDAAQGQLITFGVQPTGPETGYGYLELMANSDASLQIPQPLKGFVEKPDQQRASEMLKTGRFLWNAGIFLFSAKAIIQAYRDYEPSMLKTVESSISRASSDLGFTRLAASHWNEAQSISIDYAIMEKAKNLKVMALATGWSDLGSWAQVKENSAPDDNGTVCCPNSTSIDCRGTLLRSEDDGVRLVGIGLENMVAVATADAVVIAPLSEAQRVGQAVSKLAAENVPQATASRRDYRPWGWFESLILGEGFQVKRLVVRPGASLSLQSHKHRSEHWVVVSGTASVQLEGQEMTLSKGESIYVPANAQHRLRNCSSEPVSVIEVQTGGYLGEDDIQRYEDVYSRS